jgi:hypothetical protein
MNTLGLRTKLLFTFATILFILFLAGESDAGQRLLRGEPSENPTVYQDQYGSAGIMPLVYCAVPSGVLLLLSLVSYKADRRRVG